MLTAKRKHAGPSNPAGNRRPSTSNTARFTNIGRPVTDAAGRILQFTYDEFFNLDKIIDPVELEDQADPDDPEPLQEREWTFTRGNLGHLSTIRDPMGYLIDMQYDSKGRIERIADKHHIDDFPGGMSTNTRSASNATAMHSTG